MKPCSEFLCFLQSPQTRVSCNRIMASLVSPPGRSKRWGAGQGGALLEGAEILPMSLPHSGFMLQQVMNSDPGCPCKPDLVLWLQYMGPRRCARWTSETYTVLPASRALVERSARLRLIKDFKNITFHTKTTVDCNSYSEDGKYVTGMACPMHTNFKACNFPELAALLWNSLKEISC